MSHNINLTSSEKEIMTLLWDVGKPLSGSEILSLSENKTFKESYIHLLITSLLKKEMIKLKGLTKTTKNYARTFEPAMSQEEYTVKHLVSTGIFKAENIPFIIDELLKKTEDHQIVSKVEEVINQKKLSLT